MQVTGLGVNNYGTPLVDQSGAEVDQLLPPLLVELESLGLRPRVQKVGYEFQ